MMPTTSKVFLDSSFFIEGYKGNHLEFYHFINTNPTLECYINPIVCSEYWYNLLGLLGGSSPLTLKVGNKISVTINKDIPRFEFFRDFSTVAIGAGTFELALSFINKHNLLSNDALILANCVLEKIPFLASHDADFENACKAEGITLVTPDNYAQFFTQPSTNKDE